MENYDLKIRKYHVNTIVYRDLDVALNMYSFKDLCDLMEIEPKERTRIGRKVKPYAKKITINIDDKDKVFTYVDKSGILLMLRCLKNKMKYICYYFLYNKLIGRNLILDYLKGNLSDSFDLTILNN